MNGKNLKMVGNIFYFKKRIQELEMEDLDFKKDWMIIVISKEF